MEGYEEIFKNRGKSYHQAMEKYPLARKEEFEAALSFLRNQKGGTLLDLPAGGGYLKAYLPADIQYLGYDFSGEFEDGHSGIRKCKESKIDLSSGTVDEVITLAALHHIVNRQAFYEEMYRVLKPGGQFVIGDVVQGSKVDPFLNGFLNKWNSMGHDGLFIDMERDQSELRRAGFGVSFSAKSFNWNFNLANDAQDFFRKLFFLDKNPSAKILEQALTDLGVKEMKGSYQVTWSLGFITATKQ